MTEDINPKQVTFALDSGSEAKENKDEGNPFTVADDKIPMGKSAAQRDGDQVPNKDRLSELEGDRQ